MPTLDERIEAARKLDGYTPGPWVRDCWDILGKGQGTGQVCEVTIPNGDDDVFWKPGECEGNVALIAAAPDLHRLVLDLAAERERLLAALEPFAELADRYDPHQNDDHHPCWGTGRGDRPTLGDLRRARAALASEPRA